MSKAVLPLRRQDIFIYELFLHWVRAQPPERQWNTRAVGREGVVESYYCELTGLRGDCCWYLFARDETSDHSEGIYTESYLTPAPFWLQALARALEASVKPTVSKAQVLGLLRSQAVRVLAHMPAELPASVELDAVVAAGKRRINDQAGRRRKQEQQIVARQQTRERAQMSQYLVQQAIDRHFRSQPRAASAGVDMGQFRKARLWLRDGYVTVQFSGIVNVPLVSDAALLSGFAAASRALVRPTAARVARPVLQIGQPSHVTQLAQRWQARCPLLPAWQLLAEAEVPERSILYAA